ncbi:MAG: hypothetical protein NWP98_09320 [Erythrobacter sp.]|nr:hypothetical protein [Erythrobacter sp.]
MTAFEEYISLETTHAILAWVGLLVLIFRAILSISSYDNPPPKLTVERHVDLACTKTGYVAAFMARNGILVTLSVFVVTGISNIYQAGFTGLLTSVAVALAFCFLIYHAGLVLLVTGRIIERWNVRED